MIVVDPEEGVLEARVQRMEWREREAAAPSLRGHHEGMGRELFATFRMCVTSAEEGAMTFGFSEEEELDAEMPPVEDENTVRGW